MTQEVAIISVVRDPRMYERCVSANPFCSDCRLVTLDNRDANLPVTVLYNKAICNLLKEGFNGWMVFCHEDWQAGTRLADAFAGLGEDSLYGVVGVDVESWPKADLMVVKGSIWQGSKDGGSSFFFSGRDAEGKVGTFDCQCLIVHSSLFSDRELRFDENLRFDMYVEDFCAAAAERYGINSYVIPLKCTHWSKGSISGGFRESMDYVRDKYAGAKYRYASIAGHKNCFGARAGKRLLKWKDKPWNAFVRFLYDIG